MRRGLPLPKRRPPPGLCHPPHARIGGSGNYGWRGLPAMSPLQQVDVGAASLERFETVLTEEQWDRLQAAAERARRAFAGRVIWNINSTARGGGVAELLAALVPYSRAAGVDVRWLVIEADPAFFRVTK